MSEPVQPLDATGHVSGELVQHIRAAAAALDRPAACKLAASLRAAIREAPGLPERPGLGEVLHELRRLRLFEPMRELAEAAVEAAPNLAEVRRQYGQALIENGELTAALSMLRSLAADTAGTDLREHAEARGLIGRVHKQAYVGAVDPSLPRYRDRLRRSIVAYDEVFQEDRRRHVWHGVNVLALLYRARLDRVELGPYPETQALAAELVETALSAAPLGPWDLASAMEAAVGLGDDERALRYAYRYVRCPAIDAFMLAGTLRQMIEVWALDRERGGPRQEIVDLLRAHLLQMENGGLRISPSETEEGAHATDAQDQTLEAILGHDAYVTIEWYREGLTTAQAVAKVHRHTQAVGTGFLMWSDDLGVDVSRQPVLVTNNHVMAEQTGYQSATAPSQARVAFEAAPGGRFETRVKKIEAEFAPMPGLDVTVATLHDVPPGVEPLVPSLGPPVNDPPTVRLYSIGHPKGGGIHFSLQDNRLLDVASPLVHYRTPTDPGSSGSPVLNHDWEVVGVHRRGGTLTRLDGLGHYAANEGVLIHEVAGAIRAQSP